MKHNTFVMLGYCYLLMQSACAFLPFKASEQKPMTESAKASDFMDHELSAAGNIGGIKPLFESAEHKRIGDAVSLYYVDGNVSGLDFGYQAGSQTLSFGYIVALAGDFYANYKFMSRGCVEQISDSWTSQPEQSIKLFQTIAKSLSSDSDGYLKCIVTAMAAQEKDVQDGISKGKDPAQVYKSIASSYDKKYSICTKLGYLWIALCNWDHFGIDAVHAYSAGHTAALRTAKDANESGQSSDLKKAYFLEGFALHYLTDLFSTGHMREPRRILHKMYTNRDVQPDPEDPELTLYPADQCAQRQHDEDCANGLWVRNRLGEAWPAYGDKQLFGQKSAKNFKQAVSASQSGIAEIWDTYRTGIIPATDDFEALKRIPILDDLNQPPNSVPLFQWNESVPGLLFLRKDLPERNDSATVLLSASLPFDQWEHLVEEIDASPQNTNMYPFSQSFTSTATTVHFREQFSPFAMVINFYGPLEPGPIWNMQGQSVTSLPDFGDTNWTSVSKVGIDSRGAGVYSLVGSTLGPNHQEPTKATHIGVSISNSNFETELKWTDNFDDGNADWTLVDAIHGTYSRDSTDTAMIKYWKNGPEGPYKFEVYSIPADFSSGPNRVELDWPYAPINDFFSYRIQPTDTSDMLVTLAYDITLDQTLWNFTSLSNGYSKITTYSFSTPTPLPVQTLTGILGSDSPNASIVQLYYGDTFPYLRRIGVTVVQPSEDPSGKVSLPESCFTQTFPINWPARNASEYLLWFLSDVDGDGFTDIVGYASSKSNTKLTVIVFPGYEGCRFGDPVRSEITFPTEKGTLFTSDFMHPVYARQAAYSYTGGFSTDAGILSFFDNYGILGARMIAPVTATGNYHYEFKGQTPAIAGQLSPGLGWRAQNHTGRGEPSEAIGFTDFH